ncbi:unnamed protein product, partial [marine sediment metagenome]
MYIIIAGAGIVGFHIASLLAQESHEVAASIGSRALSPRNAIILAACFNFA